MPVPGSGKTETWPDAVRCFMVSWLRYNINTGWRPYPSANARRTKYCHLHEPFQTVTYKSVSFLGCNPTAQLPSPVALGGCDSVGWMLHPFSFRHGNMRELKRWNPVP